MKRRLPPGERANEREFRLRLECTAERDPCKGKPHLHMNRDWAALSYFPHTLDGGRPDRYAFRPAMYARRNSNESLHAALKASHKVGLDGADRTRTNNER